jgi:hypothetical protein
MRRTGKNVLLHSAIPGSVAATTLSHPWVDTKGMDTWMITVPMLCGATQEHTA